MHGSAVPALRDICRKEKYYGYHPGAPTFIARSGQSAYYMAGGRKITSGHQMSEAGYFARPCDESHGWDICSLHSCELAVSRNLHVVRDPKTRNPRLSLSDDLSSCHGALDTAPAAYCDAVVA